MPKISVIIPVYRDLQGLKKTIRSLGKQTYVDYEIIVVNDGADSGIEEFCNTNQIRFSNILPNKGSYNARNVGINMSQTDYLAFTDADLETAENWLAVGVQNLEKFDYVAGSIAISKELIVDIATFHDYLTAFPVQKYFEHHHFGVTANLFVRKRVFDKVGLFDAELKSGGDLEFGDRVHRAGILQIFVNKCLVRHPPRGHEEKVGKFKRVRQGQIKLIEKYPERFAFLKSKRGIKQLLKDLIPPYWKAAREIYQEGFPFSIWALYTYLYKLKLLVFRINYLDSLHHSK